MISNRQTLRRLGCSSSLGHNKSTLVERQAPEAMATAVTTTWVMVKVMAPRIAGIAPEEVAAMVFKETKIVNLLFA
ncbi:hypothetical protein SLEP1_g17560 [Rubroshorea leprosula]|uniref:Uncharacterized protein n=1 Tax=Rubroshorea leprosula TaxID=152421 RepID=A0AAV5J592_9ROSI|nr:hypothetical protein SLEP1_g17560 [Rubroshorea leprosula]